jgi:hypothetical protein
MGEVIPTRPTVVFQADELKRNGLVHWVIQQDAVPNERITLVTTACGITATGFVRMRRGFNCHECRDAERRSQKAILRHAEKVPTKPV